MAAYERSISRAQKIQMESLQRQLKVKRSPVPSLHRIIFPPAVHPSKVVVCGASLTGCLQAGIASQGGRFWLSGRPGEITS